MIRARYLWYTARVKSSVPSTDCAYLRRVSIHNAKTLVPKECMRLRHRRGFIRWRVDATSWQIKSDAHATDHVDVAVVI